MKTETSLTNYEMRVRYFYIAVIVILFFHFFANVLFSEIGRPALVNPSIDNFYWVFQYLGLHQLFTHSVFLPAIGDMTIATLTLLCVFSNSYRTIWTVLFTILFCIYIVTFNTFSGHHFHGLVGVLFLSVAFWFKPGARYERVWEAARYYFLFIFSSAAIWKIARGSVFVNDQFSNILKSQHAQYLFQYSDGMFASVYRFLILNSSASHLLLIAAVLLQLSFITGFFTKKHDHKLFLLAILFSFFNFFVMHIFSFELMVMGIALLDFENISFLKLEKEPVYSN
jgi:hypothetical protein